MMPLYKMYKILLFSLFSEVYPWMGASSIAHVTDERIHPGWFFRYFKYLKIGQIDRHNMTPVTIDIMRIIWDIHAITYWSVLVYTKVTFRYCHFVKLPLSGKKIRTSRTWTLSSQVFACVWWKNVDWVTALCAWSYTMKEKTQRQITKWFY